MPGPTCIAFVCGFIHNKLTIKTSMKLRVKHCDAPGQPCRVEVPSNATFRELQEAVAGAFGISDASAVRMSLNKRVG